MSDVRISICIATFNRAAFIGETLQCVCSQVREGIEVIVLDGGSSDATESIARGFEARYSFFRYVRQATNGGVDRDFDLAVMQARGEYCWLMSDDDLIKPGAIDAVLDRINATRPDLVIVNAEVCNADFSKVIDDRRLRVAGDRAFAPNELERLFVETGLYLSFIGCVVIRRETWLERTREPYFGSMFIHMGVIFQRHLDRGAYVMAEPWIRIRYGNANWKPREFEVWMVKWPTLVWSFGLLTKKVRQQACPGPSIRLAFRLFRLRAKGAYTTKEFRDWSHSRNDRAWFRVLAWCIAATPGVAVNLLAMGIFAIKSARGISGLGLEIFDLKGSRFSPWRLRRRSGAAV